MKLPKDLIDRAAPASASVPNQVRDALATNATQSAAELDGAERVERRKRMIAAVTTESVFDAFERYVGNNELLPVNYLLFGYLQSKSVGRIRYFDKQVGKPAVATGFLISDGLLLTNHHVFPVKDIAEFKRLAQDPAVEFNHEYDLDGNRPQLTCFLLEPERLIYTCKELDVAIVAVAPKDRSGAHDLTQQGYLVLNGALGKAGRGDFATIIQHPAGAEKQIAIRKNEIIDIDQPDSIIYVSDTAQGSSGAPVFNDQWQVIALHSAGVAKQDARGYLDKNDEVIEPVGGYIDEERIVWVSNRGTRVSSIMNHLRSTPAVSAHPLIQNLFSPAYTDSRPYAFLSRPAIAAEERLAAEVVAVTPAATRNEPVNINITISTVGTPTARIAGVSAITTAGLVDPFEKKYEDELDFSDCTGFDSEFLGKHIPMPVPNEKLRKKLAYLKESPSSYTLKYHHFSAIHHAVRRVPVVSGINVHSKYRHPELDEEGSRKDKWIRDNRIDYDVQLNDAFYAKSGFDRGHLARREDAEWGTSVANAKLAADLTCSYVNAVPQVPALNRAKFGARGKWGMLEEELLEKGVEPESGKAGRICVFAGPLFDDENDPVYKGVQVALSFFKIVVWYDGDGELRTTCYRLSQEKLVGKIEFEVLRFDEIFKTYQIPITEIQFRTGLKFHETIVAADTSSGSTEAVE